TQRTSGIVRHDKQNGQHDNSKRLKLSVLVFEIDLYVAQVFRQSQCRSHFREFRRLKIHRPELVPIDLAFDFLPEKEKARNQQNADAKKNYGVFFIKFSVDG